MAVLSIDVVKTLSEYKKLGLVYANFPLIDSCVSARFASSFIPLPLKLFSLIPIENDEPDDP